MYSEADIAALIAATASLRTPLRRATFATLIGLPTVIAIRIGEAIALNRSDVDLTAGRLVVQYGSSARPGTRPAPDDFQSAATLPAAAGRVSTGHRDFAVLRLDGGTRLIYCNVHDAFHRLVRLAGLTPHSSSCRPRIHDLRHSFAVAAMLDACRAGEDGQTRLTLLSTWLGHVHPGGTYWYLSASPELMAVAGQRLETHLAAQSAGRP